MSLLSASAYALMVRIKQAWETNGLDDEGRRFYGENDERESDTPARSIELIQGRGGRCLLTLQEVFDAIGQASEVEKLDINTVAQIIKALQVSVERANEHIAVANEANRVLKTEIDNLNAENLVLYQRIERLTKEGKSE